MIVPLTVPVLPFVAISNEHMILGFDKHLQETGKD